MGHHSCCNRQKVKRGLWSPEEDEKLINYISTYGHGCWSSVPRLAGLQRCGKSCRLRWINYLRPDLRRGSFSRQEAAMIIELHRLLGNKWAQIAKHLPGRTDNEVKNFWNSSIKKKLVAAQQQNITQNQNLYPNSSTSCTSSDQTPYFINPNFIPLPQLDHIPIPNNPLPGFDPIESRFEEIMNYHANYHPIIAYTNNTPPNFPCNNIPQNNSMILGFDAPNPLLINSNLDQNLQPHPTISASANGNDVIAPSSSATQDQPPPLLHGAGGNFSDFPPPPPSPMTYIESFIAALESPGPASVGDSSTGSTPPLPCSSTSFLDDPSSFVSIWATQP